MSTAGQADNLQEDNPAYPRTMEKIEHELLKVRRGQPGNETKSDVLEDAVGIGLSGGGIRSATFCLGLFQGLVKQKVPKGGGSPEADQKPKENQPAETSLLSKIDYLSTVSGGGYFGAFYGRLFTREAISNFSDVEDILTVRAANEEERTSSGTYPKGKVFRWLRENGRYLAPNGSGDLLLAGAVVMRNWVAVQIVWGTFVLLLFLFAQFIRGLMEVFVSGTQNLSIARHVYRGFLFDTMPWGSTYVWWSPYTIVAPILFLVLVVPPAWSYWLVEKPHQKTAGHWITPWAGLLVVLVLAVSGIYFGMSMKPPILSGICGVVTFVAIETSIWAKINRWMAESRIAGAHNADADRILIDRDEQTRNQLSRQLEASLVITGAVLAFVIIDSLAQTGYGTWLTHQLHVKRWMAAVLAPMLGLAGFARTLFSSFGSATANKKVSLPLTAIAGIAAFLVGLLVLVAFDFGAYAIAWNLRMPKGDHPEWTTQKVTDPNTITATLKNGDGWVAAALPWPPGVPQLGHRDSYADLEVVGAALVIAFVFSFLFGWSWPFLNRSTYHPIYTARLIRAYLGASNSERLQRTSRDVTETIEGDDIRQEYYWPRFALMDATLKPIGEPEDKSTLTVSAESLKLSAEEQKLAQKGMPIHLINVTINETIDAASQIEQQDNKGTGMAVGPAGFSIGVKHHLVLEGENRIGVYPRAAAHPTDGTKDPAQPYRVFDFEGSLRRPERLTLGNWTGISGAAFSTSLGWRTSLSLSLLAGLANVRLSYWWNSGTINLRSKGLTGWVSAAFQWLFSVQNFLFDEFLARFHGTARRFWPLSDGGHFENMGGYELIRRRLPMIIIVDAEADADYTFEGLANLVRKARLDFGAEIRFLTEYELDAQIHSAFRRYFGTLDQLRRGRWGEEPVTDPVLTASKRLSIDRDQEEALSLAHVALAKVTYQGCQRTSTLLYIKPTLIGDEPADVRRYHTEHPSFPHETTAEQFFDEAQWESYRRLGEHIADKVFRSQDEPNQEVAEEAGKFLPCQMKAAL
jgi:hypothetical protein